MFIQQLESSGDRLRRIKVKVFGSSGTGKTTLIDSMNCSYLNSFFRRTRLSSKASNTKQKSYGLTRNYLEKINSNQLNESTTIIECKLEANVEEECRNPTNILDNYELINKDYTKGINSTQCTLCGSHFTLWEFSGYEPYKNFYDPLINTCHVFLIVYKVDQSEDECVSECIKWTEYLRSRLVNTQPVESQLSASMSSLDINTTSVSSSSSEHLAPIKAKLIFVGTHSDQESNWCQKTASISARIDTYYSGDDIFDLSERHYVLDARAAWDTQIKLLNQKLASLKHTIVDSLPKCTVLLNRTLNSIQEWRKMLTAEQTTPPSTPTMNKSFSFGSSANAYPILTWKQFVSKIRDFINPLANDDHLIRISINWS